MRNPLILSLLALVFSAIALTTALMTPSSAGLRTEAPHRPTTVASALSAAAETPDRAAPYADLLLRVEAVDRENRELRDRLALLETQAAGAQRAPAETSLASREEIDALRKELLAVRDGRGLPGAMAGGETPSPEFTQRVEQSMSEIRVKQAMDGARKSVESRTARLQERLPVVSQKLGLNPHQEQAMESALLTLYETQANYGVLWATGEVARVEFGGIKQNDIEVFQGELEGILRPDQLETYAGLGGEWGDLFPGGVKQRQ